jgi:CRISPR-associated protein Csm4
VYLKTISDEWTEQALDLFKLLSKSGYGRKKSIGKGQFSVEEFTEFNFKGLNSPNGFVTLSSFCPATNDPIKGLYKTQVKYGKLGDEYTFSGNPFKRPLAMVKTGSVFWTDGPPSDFYGRIVRDISPSKPEVVQYAYAFAIPILVGHDSLLTQ